MKSSTIYIIHQILLGLSNKGGKDGRSCVAKNRNTYKISVKRLEEDLGTDVRLRLKFILWTSGVCLCVDCADLEG
jgi:hypothetical protein